MTTIQMAYFLKAAKLLNFTTAADQLYITQPTLSRQISLLEAELNAQLFIRRNNSVQLTQAGRICYQGITDIMSRYDLMRRNIDQVVSGVSGEIRLLLLEDQILSGPVIDAMQELSHHYPNIVLELNRSDIKSIHDHLIEYMADFAVTMSHNELYTRNLSSIPLNRSLMYMAIPKTHPLSEKDGLSLAECECLLEELPLIKLSMDNFEQPIQPFLTEITEKLIPKNERQCPIRYVSTPNMMTLLVSAGLGVAIVNQEHILSIDPNITLVPIQYPESLQAACQTDTLGVVVKSLFWSELNPNPLIPMFIKTIRRYIDRAGQVQTDDSLDP